MEWLVIGLLVAGLASVAVLAIGAALATYRDRRARRRLVPPGGGPSA